MRFLSNNPTKDPEQYAAKLGGLGLPTPVDEIVGTTVVTTTRWLLAHAPDAVVFPIAEDPLVRALAAAGIRSSQRSGRDRRGHRQLRPDVRPTQAAGRFDAIWFHRRARLIATNPDRYCPLPGGRGEPDIAAIVAAIEACTG